MDFVSLIRRAFLSLLASLVVHASAFAGACPVQYWGATPGVGQIQVPDLSNASLTPVCQLVSSNYVAAGPPNYVSSSTQATANCGYWSNGTFTMVGNVVTVNKIWVDDQGNFHNSDPGTCAAPPPCPGMQTQDPATGKCVCADSQSVGQQMVSGDQYSACSSSCQVVLQKGWYDPVQKVTFGNWSTNGNTCQTSDQTTFSTSDPKLQAAKACGADQVSGTVNGQTVCVPVSSSSVNPKVTQSADQSASQVDTPASGASSVSGSDQSTTSQTECSNGQCTTKKTTTTKNSDGSTSVGVTVTTKDQQSFCQQNPTLSICQQAGWSGSCASGFSCSGDAVQCAQAQAAWKSACATAIDPQDPLVTAGNAAMNGTTANADPSALGGTVDVSSFDQSERYTGGCPADTEFSAGGHSITIPLSKLCPYAQALGYAAVSVCLIAAMRIAFGG